MRRCHRCDRHVFEASTRCPFCGATHRVTASPAPMLGVLLGLALASCTDRPSDDEGAGSGGATTSMTGGTTTASGSGPLTGSADGTGTATDVATTAMSATATDDGTTGGTAGTGTVGTTDDTTAGPGGDTVTVPPYGGAFPDDDEAASTTGEPAP